MDAFFEKIGISGETFFVILISVIAVLFVALIVMFILMRKMYKSYDMFMRGKDAESLEGMIKDTHAKVYSLQDQVMDNRDRVKKLQYGVNASYSKTGVVKYNAFDGMGGQSSFAMALLDYSNNGIILNAMHSRTSCYLYIKEIKSGNPDSALGKEEQQALDKALGRS